MPAPPAYRWRRRAGPVRGPRTHSGRQPSVKSRTAPRPPCHCQTRRLLTPCRGDPVSAGPFGVPKVRCRSKRAWPGRWRLWPEWPSLRGRDAGLGAPVFAGWRTVTMRGPRDTHAPGWGRAEGGGSQKVGVRRGKQPLRTPTKALQAGKVGQSVPNSRAALSRTSSAVGSTAGFAAIASAPPGVSSPTKAV